MLLSDVFPSLKCPEWALPSWGHRQALLCSCSPVVRRDRAANCLATNTKKYLVFPSGQCQSLKLDDSLNS